MSKQICNCCHEHKEHKSWKAYTCNDCLDKGLKYCPSCDSTQPISNFYKNGHTIRSYCKECENIRSLNNKQSTGYYSRPEVRKKRNEDSSLCKRAKYTFDEEYRLAEIIRCHERRQISTVNSLTPTEWLEAIEAFDKTCAYCGSIHNLTMDHVIAVSNGGTAHKSNIIPACSSCNSSKQASDMVEWYTKQIFYSKERLDNILKFLRTRR